MKLHQLKALDAVARLGGIRAAARELGLSQPALTKALKELEREAGLALLVRGSRGARLNPAGRMLLARARAILNEIDCAEMEMRQMAGGQSAAISFAISPVLGEAILAEALSAFRERHPQASLRIVEAYPEATMAAVADGSLDFAFMLLLGAEAAANLVIEPHFQLPNIVVARRGHPLAEGASVEELLAQEWVISNRAASGQFAILTRMCAQLGREMPPVITEIASLSLIKATVQATDALAIAVAAPGRETHPDFVKLDCPAMEAQISHFGIVRSASSALTPPAQWMRDRIVKDCARLLAGGQAQVAAPGS